MIDQLAQNIHCGHAEPEFWLPNGRQRNDKIFRHQNIPKTADRNVLRDSKPLLEQDGSGANRRQIIRGLDRCWTDVFIQHLERRFFSFFYGGPGDKDEALVIFYGRIPKGSAITFETFMRPGRGSGPGEESDLSMSQLKEVRGALVAGKKSSLSTLANCAQNAPL